MQTHESLIRGQPGHLFVVITLGAGTIKLGRYLLPPLLPAIIDTLSISSFAAGVAMSVVGVAFALVQYPGGRFADSLSRVVVLFVSMVLCVLGFLLLMTPLTYPLLLVGVAFVGAGDGLFAPTARAKLSDLYHHRRGQAFGVHMAFIDVGGIAASGLAVVVLSMGVWQIGFLPGVFGLIAIVASLWIFSDESYPLAPVDLAVKETVDRLVTDTFILKMIVVYSLLVFTWQGIVSFLPIFLQQTHDFTPGLSSAVFALLFVAGIAIKPLAGRLSDALPRLAVATGALVAATVGVGLVLASPLIVGVVVGVLLYAAGHKGFAPVVQAYFMDIFPDESKAGDLGAVRTVYLFVGSLGPTYVGYTSSVWDYRFAFTGFILILAVAVLVLLAILHTKSR